MTYSDALIRALPCSPGQVVLGVGSAAPVVIDGLTTAEQNALVALGGLTPAQWRSAETSKPPSERWPQVLDAVSDAAHRLCPPLSRPAMLVVDGSGTGTAQFVAGLAAVADQVVTDRVEIDRLTSAYTLGLRPETPTTPDIAVLTGTEVVAARRAAAWRSGGIPHLPVVFGADGFVVGPWVISPDDPCLSCLDLHRADRDRSWARVVAATCTSSDRVEAPSDRVCHAAGVVGALIRDWAAGDALPAGTVLVVRAPAASPIHQGFSRHPRCPEHRRTLGALRTPGDHTTNSVAGHGNAPARWPRPGH